MILSILDSVSSVSSRNEKIRILSSHQSNDELKKVFLYALNPYYTYGIKKIPDYSHDSIKYSLSDAFGLLDRFRRRELTGNAAIDALVDMLTGLSQEDAIVLNRIILKDLRIGASEGAASVVWPGLIPDFPVMKATAFDAKSSLRIVYPAYSQVKLDGARLAIRVCDGVVECFSSSGRPVEVHGSFDYLGALGSDFVLDGELLYKDTFGKVVDRKTGNGIVNKAIKGTISPQEAGGLHFVAFDRIPLENFDRAETYNSPYRDRLSRLADLSLFFRHNISLVNTRIVNSEKEAVAHFRELLSEGFEGTILKNYSSVWENKRSKDQIKFKGLLTCDLRCVGIVEGTGKYVGKMGALLLESADGELSVSVGTGFSDLDRAQPQEYWLDRIIETAYNERIKPKTEGSKHSLFLPRYMSVRLDKTKADTLANIPEKGIKE